MDAIQQIKDEFLVCPICLQHYKNPKLLPCLHTFCLRCLEDFVQKAKNGDIAENGEEEEEEDPRKVTFKCPVCRSDSVFELSEDFKKIESGFTDNHLISNLMEKIDVYKAEQVCESCRGQGQRTAKAEVWCQNCKVSFCDTCIKAHNVIKACDDHVVISLRDMKVNPLQSFKNTKRDIACTDHPDKLLEFYCLDCRIAICSTCVAVQHRKCEMVETCADSAQKLKPETENVLKDLESQRSSLTDWQQDHIREIDELEENKSSLVNEIKSIRKTVDAQLVKLEKVALEELDTKHTGAISSVKERLQEIEDIKRNLENTNMFLKHLVQYGSDSEFLCVFDKVKQQIIEMNTSINRRKIAKLQFRHKFAIDSALARVFELKSLGKIVDVIGLNEDSFPVNGENGLMPPSPVRKSSIKRTGTFKVERPEEEQHVQKSDRVRAPRHQISLQPIPSPSKNSSRGSLSTNSPSTSTDSMSSQEMLESAPRKRTVSARARQQQETSARLAAGCSNSLPRAKRVNSSVEFRKTQAIQSTTQSKGSKTPPVQRRSQSTVNGRPPTGDKPIRPERRSKTPDNGMLSPGSQTPAKKPEGTGLRSPSTPRRTESAQVKKSDGGVFSPPLARRSEITPPKSPKQPRPAPIMDKTNAQLLCEFNGRTESDNKKCWPLDVTVLCDGTPVITDFHNKKIKAFDASGMVMCDVLLPSWPHGIANYDKTDVAVTLPEISTLVFVTVNENTMILKKRIKTVKQYRGICCHAEEGGGKPVIIVSCCASNNQSVDVLSLEGEILHSYRHDNRTPGRTLFTWPYYVTVNGEGEIIVSDCETKTGLLYLDKKGDVKYDCLSINVVIQDPRGICTDIDGNVYLADKSAHAIHSFTSDGHYRKCVVSARDELVQPIAVCVSPFGHIIVTQDNGDIKVYAID